MIQVNLTAEQRQELQRRLRYHGDSSVPAFRLEIVRLAADGWRIPAIARGRAAERQKTSSRRGYASLPERDHALVGDPGGLYPGGRSEPLEPCEEVLVCTERAN